MRRARSAALSYARSGRDPRAETARFRRLFPERRAARRAEFLTDPLGARSTVTAIKSTDAGAFSIYGLSLSTRYPPRTDVTPPGVKPTRNLSPRGGYNRQ